MSQPLLEASQETRQAADESRLLRLANAKLEEQLAKAKEELRESQQAAAVVLKSQVRLRKLLQPWRDAIVGIYGELAELVTEPLGFDTPNSSGGGSIWRERISKAGAAEARVLQTLLDGGGEMTLTQIRQSARTFNNTNSHLNRLIAKNWVQKTGRGSYTLKSP